MYYGEPSYLSPSYGGEAHYYTGSNLDNTLARIKGFQLLTQGSSDGNSISWRETLKSLYDAISIEKDKALADDFWGPWYWSGGVDLPNAGINWDHAKIKTSSKEVRDWMDANWQKIPRTADAWVTVVDNFQLPPTKAKKLEAAAEAAAATPPANGTGGQGGTNGQNGEDPPNGGMGFGDMYLGYLALMGLGVAAYGVYQVKVKKKKFLMFKPKRAALTNRASRY